MVTQDDTQEAVVDHAEAAPKTPPRSGSGMSCGRPPSRELERMWDPLLDHGESPVKSVKACDGVSRIPSSEVP